jgi:hypothetical protein
MTLLISKSNKSGSGPVVTNYTVASGATLNLPSALIANPYSEGSVLLFDGANSLYFDYTITNYGGIRSTTAYGFLGKEFAIEIGDFATGLNYGPTIKNNEAGTLSVTLTVKL